MSRFGNETIKTPTGHIEIAPLNYIKELNFDEAVMYCTFLDVNGTKGWRLPTYEEALCIYLDEVGHLLPPSEKYYNGDGVTENTKCPYDIFGNSNKWIDRTGMDEHEIQMHEQPYFWTCTLCNIDFDGDVYRICPLLADTKRERRGLSWFETINPNDTLYTQPVRSIAKPNRYSNTIRKQRERSLLNAKWEAFSKKRRLEWEYEKTKLENEIDALKRKLREEPNDFYD